MPLLLRRRVEGTQRIQRITIPSRVASGLLRNGAEEETAMMWGPWAAPMWFWWIFPVIGLAICLLFVVAVVRAMSGGRFMCMGGHEHAPDETSELRREIRELREELNRTKATR